MRTKSRSTQRTHTSEDAFLASEGRVSTASARRPKRLTACSAQQLRLFHGEVDATTSIAAIAATPSDGDVALETVSAQRKFLLHKSALSAITSLRQLLHDAHSGIEVSRGRHDAIRRMEQIAATICSADSAGRSLRCARSRTDEASLHAPLTCVAPRGIGANHHWLPSADDDSDDEPTKTPSAPKGVRRHTQPTSE